MKEKEEREKLMIVYKNGDFAIGDFSGDLKRNGFVEYQSTNGRQSS